jgi:uncharacterized membrane-anchored protein
MLGMATTTRRTGRLSLPSRGKRPAANQPIEATARLGKRTKDLVKRLQPGEIAVIKHLNLDRIAAEELVASEAAAVINCAPSSDGTYPNAGPLILARGGVRLIDAPGDALFDQLSDGQQVRIDGGRLEADGETICEGRLLEADELARDLDAQRRRIDKALHDFTENTMAHIREEAELVSGTIDFPDTETSFRDRHVMVVVRGPDHVEDLRALRAYIRDVKPLLVGVDGGVHAIISEGWKPDLILGDMDSANEDALRCGAELIVHGYPDGRAPGSERLGELGLEHLVIPAAGTSEDVAMLLAFEKGATLIVAVGAHFNLVEFLDKQRAGMSSTFLTRLRIGETLVDAKGVSRLYNPGVGARHLAMFAGVFIALLVILVLVTPALANLVDLLWLKVKVLLGL